jgi:hypothetical protein
MLALFHIAEEVTWSLFGVQTGENLDSRERICKVMGVPLSSPREGKWLYRRAVLLNPLLLCGIVLISSLLGEVMSSKSKGPPNVSRLIRCSDLL